MKRNKNEERALQTGAATPTEAWDKTRCSRRALLSLIAAPLVPLALTSDERRKRDLETLDNIVKGQARLAEPVYVVGLDKIYIVRGTECVWEPLEITWSIPYDRTEWTS